VRAQLSILLTSIQAKWPALIATIMAFFMPIYGLLFLIGFAIILDTITGIWKAKKTKVPITSRAIRAIVPKFLLYEITVILFYLIDYFILNDIIIKFFTVPLMLTKVMALILASIEVISINENYKAVQGIDLWQSAKRLMSRAKEIKQNTSEICTPENKSSEL
jgi:hypothetical protein